MKRKMAPEPLTGKAYKKEYELNSGLWEAVKGDNVGRARQLLRAGANLMWTGEFGIPTAMLIICRKHEGMLDLLNEFGR